MLYNCNAGAAFRIGWVQWPFNYTDLGATIFCNAQHLNIDHMGFQWVQYKGYPVLRITVSQFHP
jgi:hypothetical protein